MGIGREADKEEVKRVSVLCDQVNRVLSAYSASDGSTVLACLLIEGCKISKKEFIQIMEETWDFYKGPSHLVTPQPVKF